MMFLQSFSQSLDYISVRKKNGSVVKNFYSGSDILLQQTNGIYLQGPIAAIRNDSVYLTIYDIRLFPTTFGTFIRDTIAVSIVGIRHQEIQRIYLAKRTSFWERNTGPLLMIGGAGYLALNILNGGLFESSVTDNKNLKKIGFAAGAFGLGYLLKKLFSSDGFSKNSHRVVYIDL
jgi:hypothetical protein